MWFYTLKGSECLHVSGLKLLMADLVYILPAACISIVLAIYLEHLAIASNFVWLLIAGACATAVSAPLLWKARKMLGLLKTA
jgi:hypothetical protein